MENNKNSQDDFDYTLPEQALFDTGSMWLTIWAIIGVVIFVLFWLIATVLDSLGFGSSDIPAWLTIILVLAGIPATFLVVMTQLGKRPALRKALTRLRYITALAAALWLGSYYGENNWRKSYDGRLREGAFIACAKIPFCKNDADKYADYN